MYITSCAPSAKTEGAGSQYQRYLLTYLYAKYQGWTYVHMPDVLYDGYDDQIQEVEAIWVKCFSFLSTFGKVNLPITHSLQDALSNKKIYNIPFRKVHAELNRLKPSVREGLLENARGELRKCIAEANLAPKREKDLFIIAAHFRAFGTPDIVFFPYFSFPWQYFNYDYGLPDNRTEYYVRLYSKAINQIARTSEVGKVVLRIHSIVPESVFSELVNLLDRNIEVMYCINEKSPIAFLDLLTADALLASHSSFSWLPLLLRKKPTYIRKGFRHFLTESTKLVEEVYYENGRPIKNFYRWLNKIFSYGIFYPKYYYQMLTSRLYF